MKPDPNIRPTVWRPVMRKFLSKVKDRLVVVGSVARTIREPEFQLPKDIDLLCDLDSDLARREIGQAIEQFDLRFESPFVSCWTFRDYGWMVEILGIHHGPFYRTVRRNADEILIGGVSLRVAQPEHAPKERTGRS
jgi:hypothetical protein